MSAQDIAPEASSSRIGKSEHEPGRLGFLLCWAVVFADIGTSIYYVPSILFFQVGKLAGFFVTLTLGAFILLALKYSEVTYRYPQGGGVVTVAASAMGPWLGALGGIFILVDYFLTAAISALSGLSYFAVLTPAIKPPLVLITITILVLVLLGLLNWWGITESATVSMVAASIAFLSDIAILVQVFLHVPFQTILNIIPQMFSGQPLTGLALLTGFAGAFLAFSGLESISQLSPVMKTPRKRTGRLALLLVVLTIGITSPLLTAFATTLIDVNSVDPEQLISVLGGTYGGQILSIEVAISASALLIFASNTAIIGCYHVLLALSRMRFFPYLLERRSAWRGTPHYAIALATGIPILILIAAHVASKGTQGALNVLGDLYAFGLLGAFSLTCLGLDIVRSRERRRKKEKERLKKLAQAGGTRTTAVPPILPHPQNPTVAPVPTFILVLGIITTALVMLAWSTNLVFKLHATIFGGSITGIGLLIAYWNFHRRPLVHPTEIHLPIPGSVLAVLPTTPEGREAVVRAACAEADDRMVVFVYRGHPARLQAPRLFEIVDRYLEDESAQQAFGNAESIAREKGIKRQYVYLSNAPDAVFQLWQILRPRDTIIVDEDNQMAHTLAPDMVRHSPGPGGQVTHLIKRWQTPSIVGM